MASSLTLAANYYQQSALQYNSDSVSDLGFRFKPGWGVEQSIQLAADYDTSASDRGHPENTLNDRRCLHLLGRLDHPDRSSHVTVHPPLK
jgi:TPR repeat protein